MAFSPPVVGCLVKKTLQKGGSRAPQDPPGYAFVLHQESMEWSIPNWTKHCPKTELRCKTRCLTTAAETSKQTHMKLNIYQWSKKLSIDRAICKRFPRCRGARKHGQQIWTSEATNLFKRKRLFPGNLYLSSTMLTRTKSNKKKREKHRIVSKDTKTFKDYHIKLPIVPKYRISVLVYSFHCLIFSHSF